MKFRVYGFSNDGKCIRYDVLGGAVELSNAILLRLAPLDGEPALSALEVNGESWCRAPGEDVSKSAPHRLNLKSRAPSPDRFVVERVE